jgi:hypothetical protein
LTIQPDRQANTGLVAQVERILQEDMVTIHTEKGSDGVYKVAITSKGRGISAATGESFGEAFTCAAEQWGRQAA